MAFTIEFPDYPETDMPAIPAGFEDVSWRQDACPSFINEAAALILFIDYPEPEEREFPESERFTLHEIGEGGIAGVVYTSDDWEAVLAVIDLKARG